MSTPTFIMSIGNAILWSYGNYKYTIDAIDANGIRNLMIMENTDYETAMQVFKLNFGER